MNNGNGEEWLGGLRQEMASMGGRMVAVPVMSCFAPCSSWSRVPCLKFWCVVGVADSRRWQLTSCHVLPSRVCHSSRLTIFPQNVPRAGETAAAYARSPVHMRHRQYTMSTAVLLPSALNPVLKEP